MAAKHKDAGGVTALALAAVIAYSLWGAFVLHEHKVQVAHEQPAQSLAVK
ncbi:MAG TPA: hypothetical protein VG984_02045 [Candidatus Paceibacterota bacterium]|nr:hypothetical protein [Candidatus Paceibacterota bacterium]